MAVGCTLEDSKLAIKLAVKYDHIWASIGLHPHEGSDYVNDDKALQEFHALAKKPKVVAIGETGLDFHYNYSSKEDQIKLLRFQLTVAQEHDLPVIFHVREAFEEFWPIYDEFKPRGVIHCFSAGKKELEQILARELFVGLNGIMTFTKDPKQLAAAKAIPLQKIVLETDAPFLTPKPFRGTICEPKHVAVTAQFLSNLRGESLEELARVTTANAVGLFKLR
jgi:TatD DNase family protein